MGWRGWDKEARAAANRKYKLKAKYGISMEEYAVLFEKQKGRCAICLKRSKAVLAVDHSHETGEIRGLLCRNCNTGLAMFRDSIRLLLRSIDYLS